MILRLAIHALLISSALTIVSPLNAASVSTRSTAAEANAFDKGNIAFRSAITIEAIQRSNDATVRKLIGQVNDLKRQISAGKGDAARLRIDLARVQEETLRRLTETDAKFAAERAAFVRAIGVLFDGGDTRVLALLHRYAEGDATALAELQSNFQRSTAPRAKRLIDQRALATLVVDSVRKDETDSKNQLAAYEAVLRENPDDYGALLQVRALYLANGQLDRARIVSERITAIERGPEFDNAPQMRAITLEQNSRAALQSGRINEALDMAGVAVAITRAMVAEPFSAWQSRHVGATESRDVIESYNREQLAIALRNLRQAQVASKDYAGAILSGEEAIGLRRLNIEIELRRHGKVTSASASYASDDAIQVGKIKTTSGAPEAALASFRTALALEQLGPFPAGKPRIEPHWIYVPMARAAIAAEDFGLAQQCLASAHEGLQNAQPNAYVLASEGNYWLQMGDLLQAQDKPTEAQGAWASAEAALGQATGLVRDNEEWRTYLNEVEQRLGTRQ